MLRSSLHFDFMPKLLHKTFAQNCLATAEPCYRQRSDRPFLGRVTGTSKLHSTVVIVDDWLQRVVPNTFMEVPLEL